MQFNRRSLLAVGGVAAAARLIAPAWAQTAAPGLSPDDSRMSARALGKPMAPVRVDEWFSLTCPHCARFNNDILPQIRTKLIDTGKLYYVFNDFPLDRVALMAAVVARSLPVDRYAPFVDALFHTQDVWAFARGVNSTAELRKMAALAGLPGADFDRAIADTALRNAILARQEEAAKTYKVDSTPTFIFNGPGAKDRSVSGEQAYDEFAKLVAAAAA